MKEYSFNRNKKAEEFFCNNCKKEKKSKNTATSLDGKKLCNGCYGELLSKNLIVSK